ncbi:hypothetical protein [Nocardia sp. Marseille-Q1738]
MSAKHHTYLVRLDPGMLGDSATPRGIRMEFFDWLETVGAEVVQLSGTDRVVVSSSQEVADRIREFEYVLDVEQYSA